MATGKKGGARSAARAQKKAAGDGTIIARRSEENKSTKVFTSVDVATEKKVSTDEDNEIGDDDNADSIVDGEGSESDESSVKSIEVNEISAKAKENANKKRKEASRKKTQKENTTASSSSRTAEKRKADTSTKIVKKNKTTNASDDEDITVRVEESIVVRDKKGIDKYVKRNNKLDDGTNIAEEHYRKTINYLLNKKTTVEKELSKMRKNQTVDMKDKELKNLNVKMHAWVSKILARNSLKFEIMYPTSVVKCCNRCIV